VRTGLWSVLQSERMAWLRKRLSHNPTAQGAPHEIVIEVTGQTADGTPASLRATLLDPAGQSHLTAIGVVANLERLIGLGCTSLRAGIAIPETSPDGARLLTLLAAEGVQASLRPQRAAAQAPLYCIRTPSSHSLRPNESATG
jgi:hypothetical protein